MGLSPYCFPTRPNGVADDSERVAEVAAGFEVPGYEQGETYATFYGWFRAAVEDPIAWDDPDLPGY